MATNKYDNQFQRKFSSLEKSLNRKEKQIAAIMDKALATTRTDTVFWNDIKRQLDKKYREVNNLTTKWTMSEIPKQYKFVLREQHARAKSLKSITNKAKRSINQLLKSNHTRQITTVLTQSAITDISTGLVLGRRDLDKLLAQTRQTLITESIIDTGLIQEIQRGNIATSKILSRRGTVANRLLKANENNRYIKIINKNGEPITYRITHYTEMVYRVKWHEAQSEAVRTNNANWGTDLIRVSNHNTTTEICQQYEGKIFSLNGKNKDFPIIDQLAPFHVNCLHYETTVFEESLKVQGNYDDYVKFSNNKIDQPPGQKSFIPVKERNKLTDKTIKKTKESEKYIKSTPRQKRILLRDNVGKELGKESRRLAA